MLIFEGCTQLGLEESLALISDYLTRSDGEIELVAAGRTNLMKEQTIRNVGTESKICEASTNPFYLSSQGVGAVGEELAGPESAKWYISLSLISTALGGGLHVHSYL